MPSVFWKYMFYHHETHDLIFGILLMSKFIIIKEYWMVLKTEMCLYCCALKINKCLGYIWFCNFLILSWFEGGNWVFIGEWICCQRFLCFLGSYEKEATDLGLKTHPLSCQNSLPISYNRLRVLTVGFWGGFELSIYQYLTTCKISDSVFLPVKWFNSC